MNVTQPNENPHPIIAIVGRPNVGKSTLFNRLIGSKKAIVEDVPGVTRDRRYADSEWDCRPFTAVDTGGFEVQTDDQLLGNVREQAKRAIGEATVVLFVVDARESLTRTDREIATLLRRGGTPVILIGNKMDGPKAETEGFLDECYSLGFEDTIPMSSEHGRGMGRLMEALEPYCPAIPPADLPERKTDEKVCRVAIVGRPNVGKSTLINRLLGEERFVTSDVAGTTTDSNDVTILYHDHPYVLTDTAGIRRKRSIEAKLESWSVSRSLATIEDADVVLLLVDATEPAVEQDARIAGIALEKGKALGILVNKWDLIENQTEKVAEAELRLKLPFADFVPVLFCSALTGEAVERALRRIEMLDQHARARIPTPQLNDFLQEIYDAHPTPIVNNHRSRLYYIAQVGVRPPTFAISCSYPESVSDDYQRYMINRMRESFGMKVPIRLLFRQRKKRMSR